MHKPQRLHIGAIKINSNKSNSYNSKVQHADFNNLTHGLDIIGITETHAASKNDIQKQGYHHFAIVRKKATLARSHSGAIAVLISNHLFPHMTMCDWSNPCCLAIKIKLFKSTKRPLCPHNIPPPRTQFIPHIHPNRLFLTAYPKPTNTFPPPLKLSLWETSTHTQPNPLATPQPSTLPHIDCDTQR